MGYESRVYVVDKSDTLQHNNMKWAEVVSTFNMSKFGDFRNVFAKETDCYFYEDGADGEVLTDKYGARITEASVKDVINYLEDYKNNKEHYRRVQPLLSMLKGFNTNEWRNLVVLHYGY